MKLKILIFILLSGLLSFGQDRPTTCTENNGSPCPEWLHKLIGQYPPRPDIPLPNRTEAANFFTFRTFNQPVLRTNRQVFHSKTFILLNAGYAASVIADVKYTHGVRETARSEYPVIPAIIGLDYCMDRFMSRSFSVEAPVYGMIHYLKDLKKGP